MHDPRFVIAELASALTGIAAIYACFRSALPDAPRLMPALPLVPFAIWVAMLGSGCLDEFLRAPDAAHLGTSFECLNTIVLTSIPPALVMIFMLRRVVPFHPAAVAAMGALGVCSLASAALTLYPPAEQRRDGADLAYRHHPAGGRGRLAVQPAVAARLAHRPDLRARAP